MCNFCTTTTTTTTSSSSSSGGGSGGSGGSGTVYNDNTGDRGGVKVSRPTHLKVNVDTELDTTLLVEAQAVSASHNTEGYASIPID